VTAFCLTWYLIGYFCVVVKLEAQKGDDWSNMCDYFNSDKQILKFFFADNGLRELKIVFLAWFFYSAVLDNYTSWFIIIFELYGVTD